MDKDFKPIIFCIVGPSGCGKTTLSQWMEHTLHDVNTIVSCTTRPKRPEEEDGREHAFIVKGSIAYNFIKEHPESMLAYTVFGGYEYWAQLCDIRKFALNVYVIDEAGVNYLREHFGDRLTIYVCSIIRNPENSISDKDRLQRDKGRVALTQEPDYVLYNNGTLSDLFSKAGSTAVKLLSKIWMEHKEECERTGICL